MMKRWILAVLMSWFGFAQVVAAAEFQEGRHYMEIMPQAVETGAKVEVREFFWYGCPHCYTLEPVIEGWLKKLPAQAAFVRTPVAFNDQWVIHNRTYYAFEQLGVLGQLHGKFFDALHTDRERLFDQASIIGFATRHGVKKEDFGAALESFSVVTKANQAAKLMQQYQIHSVPTFVVDGRYITSADMAGGQKVLPELLDQLVQLAAAERRKEKR